MHYLILLVVLHYSIALYCKLSDELTHHKRNVTKYTVNASLTWDFSRSIIFNHV